MELPSLPASFQDVPELIEKANTQQGVLEAIAPFKHYESKLRQVFAQEPTHGAIKTDHLTPVFRDGTSGLTIIGRDLAAETQEAKDRFILPLTDKQRQQNGSFATVRSIKDFKSNFNVFSESALVDLDWSNVVAAGSSVVTALLPISAPNNESKRALRSYYHEQLAPASDVDLFIYGLDEAAAIEKIKQIETKVKDALLSETTVVRTKNTVTIVAEYPIRHVQIVLRLYKSITEILTGFDVDCACVAFDGEQVWAAPRALGAFATQMNCVDLTRRSPSYENRLAKYSHRGFEVYWPLLDRSRVDPTIFERSFGRVLGLARLLVLEKLPHPQDRDEYMAQRRKERGRPELPWNARFRHQLPGNVKDVQPHDIAEWDNEDDVSSYHTFSIPWGPRYTPKKVEKLLYTKDLLLNAEWNKPKDRESNLHRHPAFFGTVGDVIEDCCRFCPEPTTDADLAALEEESKTFISGQVAFLKENPGRQEIGSFNPITDTDWTEMAYVGNTSRLCQAIVNCDLDDVKDWFDSEEADCNRRDHTGRTPLHLAAMCGTPEIVEYLLEHGARIVARLYNGLTSLHIAAYRGDAQIVKLLLDKSASNQEEEDKKEDVRRENRRAAFKTDGKNKADVEMRDQDEFENVEDLMDEDSSPEYDQATEGSFVKIEGEHPDLADGTDPDGPDIYDVDVVAWDSPVSALHLAILAGHHNVITLLINDYGADVLAPVKLMTDDVPKEPRATILTMLLPLQLPQKRAQETVKLLLKNGATPAQGDMSRHTALDYAIKESRIDLLDIFKAHDPAGMEKMLNHLSISGYHGRPQVDSPLLNAIRTRNSELISKVLELGARPIIELGQFAKAYRSQFDDEKGSTKDPDEIKNYYQKHVVQPIIQAANQEKTIDFVLQFIEAGADINTLTESAWDHVKNPTATYHSGKAESLLDVLRHHRYDLEGYLKDKPKSEVSLKEVEPLETDDVYLKDLPQGSYRHWKAVNDVKTARFVQVKRAERFQQDFDNANKVPEEAEGEAEKKAKISALIQKYRDVEEQLRAKGAKRFYDLYPQLKRKRRESTHQQAATPEEELLGEPFQIRFKFHVADLTPEKEQAYVELFEAAWRGDLATLKSLCLSDKNDVPPLLVATKDDNGFFPFSLAVLRGHFEVAQTILDIATVQLEEKIETSEIRYSMLLSQQADGSDGDSASESIAGNDDGPPEVYARLVDANFTISDVYATMQSMKSRVKPITLINSTCEVWRTSGLELQDAKHLFGVTGNFNASPNAYRSYSRRNEGERQWDVFHRCLADENKRSLQSLWKYAVVTNDVKMLSFLFQMEARYTQAPEDELLHKLAFPQDLFEDTLQRGQLAMVSEILKNRGQMLPLDRLAAKSGVNIEEKPKYYQGLSVYGQKRKDWADRHRGIYHAAPTKRNPPLLSAVLHGDVETIEYFLTDAPLRRYEEFSELFKEDPRIKSLLRGRSSIMKKWLESQSELILHIVLESQPLGSAKRLEFLLDKVPATYLETRTSQLGETPLHTALRLQNWPAFEILIKAGADQSVRNKHGRNLLHMFYQIMAESEPNLSLFKYFISLLDSKLLPKLVQQRCSDQGPGSMTPFAVYMAQIAPDERKFEVIDAMLEMSKESELTVMNGSGDYPLHDECRGDDNILALHLAKRRPDLIYMENATGLTPIEVSQTIYLQALAFREHDWHVNHNQNDSIMNVSAKDCLPLDEKAKKLQEEQYRRQREEDEHGDLPTVSPLYRELVKIARTNPGNRKLVSLIDANEVAKRLAAQQARKNEDARRREAQGLNHKMRRHWDDQLTALKIRDEAENWFAIGKERWSSIDWDIHVRDGTEEIELALQRLRDFAYARTNVWQCCAKAGQKGHAMVVQSRD